MKELFSILNCSVLNHRSLPVDSAGRLLYCESRKKGREGLLRSDELVVLALCFINDGLQAIGVHLLIHLVQGGQKPISLLCLAFWL